MLGHADVAHALLHAVSRPSRHLPGWTCAAHVLYAIDMSKMIQIREVPDETHNTLKARAAREGMSLSDFIKRELQRTVERPTMHEWLDRTQRSKPIPMKRTAAEVIRELRDKR